MNPDRVSVIQAACLQRWGTTPAHHQPSCTPAQSPRYSECPFPVNEAINNKICLWEGDITLLDADGIIAGTNEYTPPRRSLTDRVFHRARRRDSTQSVLDIGDVRVAQERSVVAKYLIYTVGPKFKPRSRTACDHALHTAYRNVLDKARQLGLSSIGLGVVHSSKKNYPPNYGAHIGLRTLRRYLENYPDIFKVVVLVVDSANHGIYERILPLYFPRSPIEEEAACWKLPAPLGGPWGEPIPEESEMRITENPQNIFDDDDEEALLASHQQVGEHSFSRMESDLDTERLIGGRPSTYSTGDPILDIIMRDFEEKGRYERLLRRARSEDLSEIANLGCLYQNGVDRLGRPVIIFIGKWFRAQETNLNKFILFMIGFLDYVVNHDYIVVYFHTNTTNVNRPNMSWFTNIYNILPYKYKKNLKAVYIVHPSFWTKSLTWWFTKFMTPAIKKKIHTITGIEYLYSIIEPNQLEIPAFITEYDISINGVCYYKPPTPTTAAEQQKSQETPSKSELRTSASDPQPSTSGFGSSATMPPSTSTSVPSNLTWEMLPKTIMIASTEDDSEQSASELLSPEKSPTEIDTSTWELRQSESGFRFSKLKPISSKLPGPSTSQAKPEEHEPQPGPSTSQAKPEEHEPQPGPSTSQAKPEEHEPQPGPSTSQAKPEEHEPQPGPSTSRLSPELWEPQPGPSTSQLKVDLPMVQPDPSSEEVGWSVSKGRIRSHTKAREPQPGPSTSQLEPDPWTMQPGSSRKKEIGSILSKKSIKSQMKARETQQDPLTALLKSDPWEVQPGPSTSVSESKGREPQPGPSTSQLKPDPWKVKPGPSKSEGAMSTSQSEPKGWEPEPGPLTSHLKPDPFKVQPGPSKSEGATSTSQSEPKGWEPEPGPSTSQLKTDPWKLQSKASATQPPSAISKPKPVSSTLELKTETTKSKETAKSRDKNKDKETIQETSFSKLSISTSKKKPVRKSRSPASSESAL